MLHNPDCCLDEEGFEEKIRLSKDARMKVMGKAKKATKEEPSDPIGDADKAGKRKYLEADLMWLRAARMDVTTIFYLEERAKTCYKLRSQLGSYKAVLGCFKDKSRPPVDCECEVRKYLRDVSHEKVGFAAEMAKIKKTDKSKKNEKGGKKKKDPDV